MPGLPGVALNEVEAGARWPAATRTRPAGRGRAPCRCGAATCRAGRPTSGRGVCAHSTACSASDRKPLLIVSVTPSARGRLLHPVERLRDVRPHRLALPVGERPVVPAAAARTPVAATARAAPRPRAVSFARRRLLSCPTVIVSVIATLHPHRRDRVRVGKRHVDVLRTVRRGGLQRRGAAQREVLRLLEVPRVRHVPDQRRLEQPRVVRVHHPRRRRPRPDPPPAAPPPPSPTARATTPAITAAISTPIIPAISRIDACPRCDASRRRSAAPRVSAAPLRTSRACRTRRAARHLRPSPRSALAAAGARTPARASARAGLRSSGAATRSCRAAAPPRRPWPALRSGPP